MTADEVTYVLTYTAYVSIRQHTSAYVGDLMSADEVTYVLELLGVTLPHDQVPASYLKSTLSSRSSVP